METIILSASSDSSVKRAAQVIRSGGLVAFPTETVYGLGGNGLMADAASRIYAAKGRPSDNPLILHLQDPMEAERYCYINPLYYTLAAAFMPGPLTVIMPKKPIVPDTVTGGLDTVAVRVPSDPVARRFLKECGVPVAAPSANISGRPSPTRVEHVIEDLSGRIDMILCGDECEIGLESTIVKLDGEHLTLLRPGAITPQMLESVFPSVQIDDCSMRPIGKDEKPAAPGMKYRHYAPRAKVIVLDGESDAVLRFQQNAARDDTVGILCIDTHLAQIEGKHVYSLGKDPSQMAKNLFAALRSFDSHAEIQTIYAVMPPKDGIGMAVHNRLMKAAGFSVLKL
ncbi:MAG: threonylcarbamoyl-AMP synthase [Ruminococcaceae bacterium]|nr:threonylcarbamoyl-AMP synthase [Oscillospiraceae bacterium]